MSHFGCDILKIRMSIVYTCDPFPISDKPLEGETDIEKFHALEKRLIAAGRTPEIFIRGILGTELLQVVNGRFLFYSYWGAEVIFERLKQFPGYTNVLINNKYIWDEGVQSAWPVASMFD